MNWNRWAAFFCLAGIVTFVPAVFVPAMLVANAIDGPRWYSVWSGIREFYRNGEFLLAGLIFCFSFIFPVVKFSLGLLCSAGRSFLGPALRRRIADLTSWTAKYSMLDVMVIAMLILLVKVNEYVRILPSLGLYLFSTAILLSVLAGAALNRALALEEKPQGHPKPQAHLRAPAWMVLLIPAASLFFYAVKRIDQSGGGMVERVALTRLTNRGELRRSVEKTLALKVLMKDEHDFFSKDTIRRFLEFGQAVTTDAGWKAPETWITIETTAGRIVSSDHITPVDLDARELALTFLLPESVVRKDIAVVRLVSNIEIAKIIDAPIDEEVIRRDNDPFLEWTRKWHGRIFSLELQGPSDPGMRWNLMQLAVAIAAGLWCVAALLTPHRQLKNGGGTHSHPP